MSADSLQQGLLLSEHARGHGARSWPRHLAALILLLCLLPGALRAESYVGLVVGITDGDTIKLLTPDKTQVKVRLADIDTPERGQPYGTKARQILADKIFQKQVRVEKVTIDRYKRLVGRIYLADRHINAEMVADGAAWVYRKYTDDAELLALEAQARKKNQGLWALPESQRIPPWEWRRKSR